MAASVILLASFIILNSSNLILAAPAPMQSSQITQQKNSQVGSRLPHRSVSTFEALNVKPIGLHELIIPGALHQFPAPVPEVHAAAQDPVHEVNSHHSSPLAKRFKKGPRQPNKIHEPKWFIELEYDSVKKRRMENFVQFFHGEGEIINSVKKREIIMHMTPKQRDEIVNDPLWEHKLLLRDSRPQLRQYWYAQIPTLTQPLLNHFANIVIDICGMSHLSQSRKIEIRKTIIGFMDLKQKSVALFGSKEEKERMAKVMFLTEHAPGQSLPMMSTDPPNRERVYSVFEKKKKRKDVVHLVYTKDNNALQEMEADRGQVTPSLLERHWKSLSDHAAIVNSSQEKDYRGKGKDVSHSDQ